MKFIKVTIDGKEYYERIDDDATVGDKTQEPEVIDAEIEDGEELSGTEKFMRDTEEFFDKLGNSAKEFGEKFVSGAKELGDKIKSGTERLFTRDKSIDPESQEARLLKILPYLSVEETHKICEKIMANDEALREIELAAIMPFLSGTDADNLFMRSLELGRDEDVLVSAMKYVSEGAASAFVDRYVAGAYPEMNMDKFYPFLSDANIKKLFYHIIKTSEKG